MHRYSIWLLFYSGMMLSACSISPPVLVDQTLAQSVWRERQPSLEKITHWNLNGRISITDGDDYYALKLRWRQKQGNFNIDISGAMGSSYVKLKGEQNGEVFLRDSAQNEYVANNPESLVYQHTGIHIPVNGLFYWVRGLPNPALPHYESIEFDQQGRIQKLVQDGWTVNFSDYKNFAPHQLPEKLVITHDDIEIKLIVHRWRFTS